MIPVTKPFLPSYEEYGLYLRGIWDRNWLTNKGPLVIELEQELKDYLELSNFLYVSNGTIALQLAIKALGLSGEIITTPFSYVATTSSIVWEGCTPVFVDIDPKTLNIDPTKIEDAITSNTSAILATHCFGNACDIDTIEEIAKTYGIKVVYDGAHCFGSKYKGKSVFEYGDVSTTSFHATKIFHTIEGGGVCANNLEVLERVYYMRNFGHKGLEEFQGLGINGKNSEFHAAMGLANIKHISNILEKRKEQSLYYDLHLKQNEFSRIEPYPNTEGNYSYYPIVFNSEQLLLDSLIKLNAADIFPRRYFYPPLTSLPYVEYRKLDVTDQISKNVLCLPLYHTLTEIEMDQVIEILNSH
jgi:dTDP-4-amino-4,6-dideoxygalactose transaminase